MACHLLHASGYSSVFLRAASGDIDFPLSCFKVYHKDYPLQPRHWLNISRECCILSRLQEERVDGIVQLWGVANTSQYFSLQFKPCLGGNLYQALQRRECSEERELCAKVVIPLLHVLNSLHSRGIIHRDVKPENIFFENDGKLVVGDFGLAIDSSQHQPCSRVGTPEYMAPEVFAQPSADVVALEQIPSSSLMTYGTAVDIWAIGTLVYEALTGMVPFYHPEPALMALKMQHGRPHPLPLGTSHACQAFLNAALQKEASKRPTAAELLEHPWIQQHADAAAAMVATRVKNKVLAELELDRPSTGSATQPCASRTVATAVGSSSSAMQVTPAKTVGDLSKPHVLQADATKSAGQAVGAADNSSGCGRNHDSSSSLCGPCSHTKPGWALLSSASTPQALLVCNVGGAQQPKAWPAGQELKGNKDAIVKAGQRMSRPPAAGHLRAHLAAQAAGASSISNNQSSLQQNIAHTPQPVIAGPSNAGCFHDTCARPVAKPFNNFEMVQPVGTKSSWSAPVAVAASGASTAVQPTCKTDCCKSWCSSSTTAHFSSQPGPCSAPVGRVGSGSDKTVQTLTQEVLRQYAPCCTTRVVQCIDQLATNSASERSSDHNTTAITLSTSGDTERYPLSPTNSRHSGPTGGSNRGPFEGVPAHVGFLANQSHTSPGQHRPPLLDPMKQISVQPALGVTSSRQPVSSPHKAGMLVQRLRRLGNECIAPRACSTRSARRHSFDVSGHASQQAAGIPAAIETTSSNDLGGAMDSSQPAQYATHPTPAQIARLAISLGGAPSSAATNKLTGCMSRSSACQAAAAAVTSAVGRRHNGCPCHRSHASSEQQSAQAPEELIPCVTCGPEHPHAARLPVRLTIPVGDLGASGSPKLQCLCSGRQTASSDDTSTGHARSAKGACLKVLQHFWRP